MTSPVDTTVKFFTSSMLGAPILRSQAGSMIALLDACLKDGFGIQTATSLVVASGVATLTFPSAHPALVDQVILVAGSSIAALNGEQKVTALAAGNKVSFATAAANATATGTITAKMAPVGFNKPFSGTNLAVYKSAHAQTNGQYLRIDDTGTNFARATAYETMTGISTGTGQFPAGAGLYWDKLYYTVDTSLIVPWVLVGDGRYFVLLPSWFQPTYGPNYLSPMMCAFGDPINLGRASDPYSTMITGRVGVNDTSMLKVWLTAGYSQGHYQNRDIAASTVSVQATVSPMSNVEAFDNAFDQVTGQIMFSKLVVKTNGRSSWRAELPGIHIGEAAYMEWSLANRSVFKAGTPERSYLAVLTAVTYSASGFNVCAIDVTGPWR